MSPQRCYEKTKLTKLSVMKKNHNMKTVLPADILPPGPHRRCGHAYEDPDGDNEREKLKKL